MKEIKNIIFDFGGVLYNIDFAVTIRAFEALSRSQKLDWLSYSWSDLPEEMLLHEQGLISDGQFRDGIRRHFNIEASDHQIDEAWSALLLELPKVNVSIPTRLKEKGFKLFLLSNSNAIHYKRIMQDCSELFKPFDKLYFSHDLKLRKPSKECFEAVLKDADIRAGESLFIDDTKTNIDGAIDCGLQTLWLKSCYDLENELVEREILS